MKIVNYLQKSIFVGATPEDMVEVPCHSARNIKPATNKLTYSNEDECKCSTCQNDFHLTLNKVYVSIGVKNNPEEYVSKTNELHVGMITSRWVGANPDFNNMPGNAIQGMPYIRIHNKGSCVLSLNGGCIIIPPGQSRKFIGRDHFGVRLGTEFEDDSGLYNKFILTMRATDLYYGIVGGMPQALFSGWQVSHKFKEISDGYRFRLEEGISGYGKGNISPGYVPSLEKLKEWGN